MPHSAVPQVEVRQESMEGGSEARKEAGRKGGRVGRGRQGRQAGNEEEKERREGGKERGRQGGMQTVSTWSLQVQQVEHNVEQPAVRSVRFRRLLLCVTGLVCDVETQI